MAKRKPVEAPEGAPAVQRPRRQVKAPAKLSTGDSTQAVAAAAGSSDSAGASSGDKGTSAPPVARRDGGRAAGKRGRGQPSSAVRAGAGRGRGRQSSATNGVAAVAARQQKSAGVDAVRATIVKKMVAKVLKAVRAGAKREHAAAMRAAAAASDAVRKAAVKALVKRALASVLAAARSHDRTAPSARPASESASAGATSTDLLTFSLLRCAIASLSSRPTLFLFFFLHTSASHEGPYSNFLAVCGAVTRRVILWPRRPSPSSCGQCCLRLSHATRPHRSCWH